MSEPINTPAAVAVSAPRSDAAVATAPPFKALNALELLWAVLELPIYGSIKLREQSSLQVCELRKLDKQYDRNCPRCKQQTPWVTEVHNNVATASRFQNWLGRFVLTTQCKRCSLHHSIHLLAIGNETEGPASLEKFGEWPSLAEFHNNDLGPYADVTSAEQRADFTRAIQAATSGFASGACVYLRRVLESIISEAHKEFANTHSTPEWEKEFSEAKTAKRMAMLKDHLPAFLVENRRLYNLLSQGVHSLSDAECSDLFPRLREAIELIFQGRHDILARQRRERAIAKFIAQNDNPQN